MPRAPPPGFYVLSAVVLFVWYVIYTRDHDRSMTALSYADKFSFGKSQTNIVPASVVNPDVEAHDEHVITGKLGNETLKEELGRAAWKLFHTTMAQFPDKPAADESKALSDYIHLFARLYPCGECATHFQQIIKKYPPQTSSRSSAAAWGCFVHNVVNKSKGKPEFDCANIGEWYDCGCGDEKKEKLAQAGENAEKVVTGKDVVEIQKEGPTKGG